MRVKCKLTMLTTLLCVTLVVVVVVVNAAGCVG